MKTEELLQILKEAWDIESGFFFLLRSRKFDEKKGDIVLAALKKYKLENENLINKELITLIWYIPLFLEYQKQNLVEVFTEELYDKLSLLSDKMEGEVERILDTP